jgi:hypothetical protein
MQALVRLVRRTGGSGTIALVLLGVTLVPAAAGTSTLAPTADAFVVASSPTANRGLWTGLRVLPGAKVSYLRFEVPSVGPGSTIELATLRLYASTPSRCPGGVQVLRGASDGWGERTITWANQPGSAGAVLASGSWTVQGYKDFTVTSAVSPGGPVTFVVRHPDGCATTSDTVFSSRESTANRPQLVIEATTTTAAACVDGRDNDADSMIDLDDPGCTDAADTDETDGPDENVVAAAGDIVCDPSYWAFAGTKAQCQHRSTAALLTGADAVLPLGDLQYERGTLQRFTDGYDPSWGRASSRTYPVVGNHEYYVANAQGYFDYWASKGRPTGGVGLGYYSYDVGTWHFVALNSNCAAVPCGEGTPQNDWLEQDLASTTQPCIAAYWHHPYFNSGAKHGADMPAGAKAFWDDLFAAGADLVLNGHEHNYQRYAKQDPAGVADTDGIREFIVGSGGRSLYAMLDAKDANYEAGNTTAFGVLRLYLADASYRWRFVGINGVVLDGGGPVACN